MALWPAICSLTSTVVRSARPDSRSTWTSAPAGPGPPRRSRWRCPARYTSTRVRNSGCGRSRTSPTCGARTLGAAEGMTWLSAPDGVLAFDRGGVACVANLARGPVELPQHTAVELANGRVSLACASSPDHAAGVRGPVPASGLTATMEHCCRRDSHDVPSLPLQPRSADGVQVAGRACGAHGETVAATGRGRRGLEQKRGQARDQWRDSRNCLRQAQSSERSGDHGAISITTPVPSGT
jgi:hypothetical protein